MKFSKLIPVLLLIFLMLGVFPAPLRAEEQVCDNRFATLVNPVRGRNLWYDKSLQPIRDQYKFISEAGFSASWLLQYDVFSDSELTNEIKGFTPNQELGVLLEVSQKLGDGARVVYPYDAAWFSPRAVFLSGYSQSERRRLIDEVFGKFKQVFGTYPKSVGAWWIDSYSLNYLKEKYGIKTALIVADQLTTDNYGVWGQWWGVPYYPSKADILTPASSLKNKQEVVVIQWAQRDPLLAKGEGANFSNYSLQANDYIRQGKDTVYFKNLVNFYLDCRNPLGQVTVGLETGIESVGYIEEYGNQLKALKEIKDLQVVTMSQFAEKFKEVYPEFPQGVNLSSWEMTTEGRRNKALQDEVNYRQEVSFQDYFLKDRSDFLDRKLTSRENPTDKSFGIFGVLAALGVLFWWKRRITFWAVGTLFSFAAYGLILRSHSEFGWVVYYGSKISPLFLAQIFLVLISLCLAWALKKRINIWLLPLVFGLDPLIASLRFTFVSGKYYFGFALDTFRFLGLSFARPFEISLVNMDFPAYQAAALLRFNFDKIWDNLFIALAVYPFVHILLALILSFIFRHLKGKWSRVVLAVLAVLFVWHLINIWQADPRLLG